MQYPNPKQLHYFQKVCVGHKDHARYDSCVGHEDYTWQKSRRAGHEDEEDYDLKVLANKARP